MKDQLRQFGLGLAVGLGAMLIAGCGGDYSDSGFTLSSGAQLNYSGFYSGPNGAPMVARTSGAPIMSMTLFQTGGTMEGIDNNGSKYTGNVGRAAGLGEPGLNFYANQTVVQSQVSIRGFDVSAGKQSSMAGIFTIVTLTDIVGEQIQGTETDTRTVTDTYTSTTTTQPSTGTGGGTTPPPNSGTPSPGTGTGATTTTTTTQTQQQIQNQAQDQLTQTQQVQFTLTRANNQIELRGTWIEEGGVASEVSGISAGAIGIITQVSTTTGGGGGGFGGGGGGTGGTSAGMGLTGTGTTGGTGGTGQRF